MLALIATVLLSQAPSASPRPVAVLASSKRPGVEQYIVTLTSRVQQALKREGISPLIEESAAAQLLKEAGISDSRTCQGSRTCVARLAVIVGARAVVVGVDVGRAGTSLAVLVEAIAADTGNPMLTTEFAVPKETFSDASAVPVTIFARQLKQMLDAELPVKAPEIMEVPKPSDAPVVAVLEPLPPAPEPELVQPSPPQSSGRRAAAWMTGGGAVAAGAAAVALGIFGASARGQIDSSLTPGTMRSSLPESQLRALQSTANTDFTGALVTGIAAGVLGAASVYLFSSGS